MKTDEKYNLVYKKITTPPKTPEVVQFRDTFQTPNYATDLLLPFLPSTLTHIWECACGQGKIVKRLSSKEYSVLATDISEDSISPYRPFNFLTDSLEDLAKEVSASLPVDYIITNPPYSIKDLFVEKCFEYNLPFALLINADYSIKHIGWLERGCEKIIPKRRIDFITPTGREGKTSASQFHSVWLTYGFNLGKTETFVELSLEDKKNI